VTKPCGPHLIDVAEDRLAEDYCVLGLTLFGFHKWALEFRMSVLIV
jgi:hypothetical protein